ncbi:hypothetical protein B0H11DRAFT_2365000 [Mycena galericulata]|nr:hypothetical protein B0H11DRAFT_2365000 [Mycena galericulata]
MSSAQSLSTPGSRPAVISSSPYLDTISSLMSHSPPLRSLSSPAFAGGRVRTYYCSQIPNHAYACIGNGNGRSGRCSAVHVRRARSPCRAPHSPDVRRMAWTHRLRKGRAGTTLPPCPLSQMWDGVGNEEDGRRSGRRHPLQRNLAGAGPHDVRPRCGGRDHLDVDLSPQDTTWTSARGEFACHADRAWGASSYHPAPISVLHASLRPANPASRHCQRTGITHPHHRHPHRPPHPRGPHPRPRVHPPPQGSVITPGRRAQRKREGGTRMGMGEGEAVRGVGGAEAPRQEVGAKHGEGEHRGGRSATSCQKRQRTCGDVGAPTKILGQIRGETRRAWGRRSGALDRPHRASPSRHRHHTRWQHAVTIDTSVHSGFRGTRTPLHRCIDPERHTSRGAGRGRKCSGARRARARKRLR